MERETREPIKIFYCYARQDQLLRDELEKHLTPLKRSGKIVTWCDRNLLPGSEWESEISLELNAADLILLLVSPDFICSDYCYGSEMKRAYERHSLGEAWVVPIILRPVLWKGTIISKFQLLPAEGKPVTKWIDHDEAFENVAQGIDQVVETLLFQKTKREQRQKLALFPFLKELTQPTQYTQTGHLDRRTILHKRYAIERVIGQGNMGAIYVARDIKRQEICAVKEMGLSMIPANEKVQAIQNFKTEAKILYELSHPNIPSFAGFFSENQRYFIVMEYIDGYTLEEMLEINKGPFSENIVIEWAKQLCNVLEYLHRQTPSIIFRDMKPDNIMLAKKGQIKLIDFGIARFFHPSHPYDTQLLGTPGFAPPEQYGKAQTDERSDIYSLAITLFQLLTNSLSERGFGLKNIRALHPQISPNVADALEKAAMLDPEARYSNATAFKHALIGKTAEM